MEDYAQQLYQTGFDPHRRPAGPHPDGYAGGRPKHVRRQLHQAATTMPAAGGGEVLEQMAPGAPGVGANFFNLLLSHTIAGFFADPSVQRQPEHDRLEIDRLSGVPA